MFPPHINSKQYKSTASLFLLLPGCPAQCPTPPSTTLFCFSFLFFSCNHFSSVFIQLFCCFYLYFFNFYSNIARLSSSVSTFTKCNHLFFFFFKIFLCFFQSYKKRKLSGQQDFCRKNFPDKARQFSNSRQMRIKGGFARFYA